MKWSLFVGAALLTFVGVVRAERPASNSTVKGSFAINGMTYKLTSALAYAMIVNEQEQNVVILADKPLNAVQIRASLKKNGIGIDFDPLPRLELIFDDKRQLRTMHIQTQDAVIKHLPATKIKEHKASATVSEAAVKMECRDAGYTRFAHATTN